MFSYRFFKVSLELKKRLVNKTSRSLKIINTIIPGGFYIFEVYYRI